MMQPRSDNSLETQSQISRFLAKLLSELSHVGGDACVLQLSPTATVQIRKEDATLKEVTLDTAWVAPLTQWLKLRYTPLPTNGKEDDIHVVLPGFREHTAFTALLRYPNKDSANAPQTCILHHINSVALQALYDRFSVHDYARAVLQEASQWSQGIFLIAAPQSDDLWAPQMLASAVLHAPVCWLNHLSSLSVEELAPIVEQQLVIATHPATDAIDAVRQLSSLQVSTLTQALRGVLVIHPIAANKQASAPSLDIGSFIDSLPAGLKQYAHHASKKAPSEPVAHEHGFVFLHSALLADDSLLRQLQDDLLSMPEEQHAAPNDMLFRAGARALQEDLLWQFRHGRLSADQGASLQDIPLPQYFHELYEQHYIQPMLASQAATDQPPAPALQTSVDTDTAEEAAQGHLKHILVVEDDVDQQNILELVFKAAGYRVHVSSHGYEALMYMRSETPDVVITDLMMPEMDGLELVAAMKSDPLLRAIPILVLTVVSDAEKEYELLDAGADDYCEKSVQRKVLVKRVERLMGEG